MKKLILLSTFLTFSTIAVPNSSIGISNNLDTTSQILSSPDNPAGIPQGSIWQLIWTNVNSIAPLNHLNPLSVQGSEVLLDQFNGDGETNSSFNDLDDGFFFLTTTSYGQGAGYAYARVFDYQGSGTPGPGTWFAETPVFQVSSQIPDPSPPSTVSFGAPVVMNQQIIPEPTTLMALLVGIVGLLGFRRHLQKK